MASQQPNERTYNVDTLKTFRYLPLHHDDEIRVLQILLASDTAAFRCKLGPIRLSEDPEYTALSYTWGDADAKYAAVAYKTETIAKTTIECDDTPFMITNNLHEALCVLRDKHEVTTIWVDQVCINQEDAEEKGHQIQQMQNIYAKAKLTYVWLGPEEDAAIAMPFIKDFAIAHEKEFFGLYSQTSDDYETGEPRFMMGTEGFQGEYYHWHYHTSLPQAGRKAWASLWDFFARPWFRRLWVLQEFIASKEVKVLAGTQECTGQQLSWAAAYIDIHQMGHLLRYDSEVRKYRIPVDNCFTLTNSIRKDVPLLYLLDKTRRFIATDLRDNVFALGGLCKTLEVTPDYSLTEAEVFLNTATALIKNSNSLDVLEQVHWPKERDDPSWVPDWTDYWRPPTLIQPILDDPRLSNPQSGDIIFPTSSTLTVHGFTIDKVDKLSAVLHPDYFDSHNPNHTYILYLFNTLVKPLKAKHKSSDSILSSFYKTLIANYITRHIIDAGKSPDIYHHDWTNFHIRLVAVAGGVQQDFNSTSAELFARHAGEKCNGRRFFITESGRLGLGPKGLRSGDRVMLFVGARVPFVMRTEDEENEVERAEREEKEKEEVQDDQSGAQEDGGEQEANKDPPHNGKELDRKQERGVSGGGIESHSPAATLEVAEAEIQEMPLGEKGETNRWILVGEAYIHGIDEWLKSEASKNLEESKVAFTLV